MAVSLRIDSLKALKNAQLHDIAVSIGAACSGTKPVLVQAISNTLQQGKTKDVCSLGSLLRNPGKGTRPLSLISIDLGIRNLAYAHLSARTIKRTQGRVRYAVFGDVCLQAWERMSVSATTSGDASRDESTGPDSTAPAQQSMSKESFEPLVYAEYAVKFIKTLVDRYQPTHILIERQRFRSSGQSAVQEWTLRVGVFEGMLYAVLRTLASVQGTEIYVEGVLPAKVNRYWFETHENPRRVTSRALKQAKIDLVGRTIQKSGTSALEPSIESGARAIADAYLSKWNKMDKESGKLGSITKLDDLADCLLQGLAWIHWQNRREELRNGGLAAYELG